MKKGRPTHTDSADAEVAGNLWLTSLSNLVTCAVCRDLQPASSEREGQR